MVRRLIPILLIIAMSWQSLAFAGQMLVAEAQDELEHAVLHWNSEMHHHDDQDRVHKDSSSDSKRHLVVDNCHNAPFVLTEHAEQNPIAQHGEALSAIFVCPPDPFPQGIKRPPR